MTYISAITVYFKGPELTPELSREIDSGYEGSPLAAIMNGPDEDYDGCEHDGFGFDRFEVRNGVLWGALDGLGPKSNYRDLIIDWFTEQARRYPASCFMLVGEPYDENDDEKDDDPIPVLIFNQGFDKTTDPQGIL